METTKPEAQAVADIVEKYQQHQELGIKSPDDGQPNAPVLLVPSGLQVVDPKKYLDGWRTCPVRRTGTASFGDLESFIAHANRFKDKDSAIFAKHDSGEPSLTSVLDYHPSGSESKPRFGTHRGLYEFPMSDEWRAWRAKNTRDAMDQGAFAEFIENRIVDVLDPAQAGETAKNFAALLGCTFASPSRLLELSKGLSLQVGAKLQNSVNLATGETQFTFVSQHTDERGAPIKVPGAFLIGIPVFRNGDPYQIAVRLRYRHRDGGVLWFYEMYRTEVVFDDAFKGACEKAKTDTQLPLFVGSPEV